MSVVQTWLRAMQYTASASGATLPGLLAGLAEVHGERPALLSRDETVNFAQLAQRVNRYAHWGYAQGLRQGDVIGLLMANSVDYVALWLAFTRLGCTVALLNTNLHQDALSHSLQAAKVKTLLASFLPVDYVPAVAQVWDWRAVQTEMRSPAGRMAELALPQPDDRALLIYTSGTTGLPKASVITHRRIVEWSFWFAGMMDTKPTDRLYNCLPMYHSVGGVVAIGAMLVKGGSVFIRPRFSRRQFWDEIINSECTIFQYIGELCRYLASSPIQPEAHRLRLACGNGLDGSVWHSFQQRFNIAQILEFYAATEGSLSLYNVDGKPGAIGRIPSFLARHVTVRLIKVDPETGRPLRRDGKCIPCEVDAVGEAISELLPGRVFDGYTDRSASSQKILRDVFADGDRWFRSGDLMRRDAEGYFYFVDRLGDSFRWKGENVSASEVAAVIRAVPGVTDAVVFGVAVAAMDGRAGMAAITVEPAAFSFTRLRAHLEAHLPTYARPLYVRVCQSLDVTGTYKLTKARLQVEGYSNGADPVWHKDDTTGDYYPAR